MTYVTATAIEEMATAQKLLKAQGFVLQGLERQGNTFTFKALCKYGNANEYYNVFVDTISGKLELVEKV